MIEKFFDVCDPSMSSDLRRIDELLKWEGFLQGLGLQSKGLALPGGFPVVADVPRARHILVPGNADVPWEHCRHEEFCDIVSDEVVRLETCNEFEQSSKNQRDSELWKGRRGLFDDVEKLVIDALELHDVRRNFLENGRGDRLSDRQFASFIDMHIPHYAVHFIYYMVRAVYFGGLAKSRIHTRILEAFETGGFPCGWLGPLPENGGDPVRAVAVLHFGQMTSS